MHQLHKKYDLSFQRQGFMSSKVENWNKSTWKFVSRWILDQFWNDVTMKKRILNLRNLFDYEIFSHIFIRRHLTIDKSHEPHESHKSNNRFICKNCHKTMMMIVVDKMCKQFNVIRQIGVSLRMITWKVILFFMKLSNTSNKKIERDVILIKSARWQVHKPMGEAQNVTLMLIK